jgi:molybdopterin converting factor small subunit
MESQIPDLPLGFCAGFCCGETDFWVGTNKCGGQKTERYKVPSTKYQVGFQLGFEFCLPPANRLVKDLDTLYFVLGTFTSLIFLYLEKVFISMPDRIHLKAFGMLAEKMGTDSLEIENPGSSELLKQQLLAQFPELKDMTFRMALDRKLLQADTDISQGQEIALLPPFSGG